MSNHGIESPDLNGSEYLSTGISIAPWLPEDAAMIYSVLEKPNWAPWLEASEVTLAARSLVFPFGQLVMKSGDGDYMASVSVNQIHWDGNPNSLPTWDDVAGDPTDYSATYNPNGNTLVLMSMNVASHHKGEKLPSKMILAVQKVGAYLGVEHIIGSFRPSGYGQAKKEHAYNLDFWRYCNTKQDSGKPVDPWLRSLAWNGMTLMAPDYHAMTVTVGLGQFEQYRNTYQPDKWANLDLVTWECGEVGKWVIDPDYKEAKYRESNVWGRIPTT